jgi:hypothetical protein
MKKMSRVIGASSDTPAPHTTAAAASASGVPRAVVPAPLPTNEKLLTRREILLKKSFARRDKQRDDGEKKKAAMSSKAAPSSGKKKKVLTRAGQPTKVVADGSSGTVSSRGGVQAKLVGSAVQAVTKLQSNPITTHNLSAARRHDFFVKELNQFNKVLAQPAFIQDPFAAIESHLDATMRRLKPQTVDYGKKQVAGASAVPQRVQPYGQQGRYAKLGAPKAPLPRR